MSFASRVSRDLRRAGIVTIPSGTPITGADGVRVRRGVVDRDKTATVTIDGRGRLLRVVADAVADALTAAGYAITVSDTYAADGTISIDVERNER